MSAQQVDVLERATRPAAPRRRTLRRPGPLVLTAACLVAALCVLPALYLVVRAAGSAFAEILVESNVAGLFARTTLLCIAVTTTSIAIALPFAWLTTRTDLPGRRTWVVVSSLPLVIPSFVGGYAFVAALGPRGLLQSWLEPLGVDRIPTIYGFAGAWLVLSLFTYPLALLPIRAAVTGLDPSLEEASRVLGRTRLQTIRRVTLPQLRPAIVSGGLLVALYTLSDFGAVSLLRFDSFTRAIHTAIRTGDRERAAVLGLVLVVMSVIVLIADARTRGRAIYHATHRGVRRRKVLLSLGPWRWPAFAACSLVIVLALVVPVGVIAIWLWRAIDAGTSFDIAAGPALNSLRASALGAIAVLLCAWPVAVVGARYAGRAARAIETASFTGYALPGIVIALALVFFGTRFTLVLYQTLIFLVIAYVIHFLPQATGPLRTSIAQIHPGVEEAARSLGARPSEVMRRVTWPLVRPGAMTAFALVFLTVMKELPATLLLAPIGFRTLATQVWDRAAAASFGEAALPALALVVLSSAPMAVLVFREHREARPAPTEPAPIMARTRT